MRPEATEEDTSPMPATEPTKIRNIAVAGHRGVGKTSLVEALLFEAGKTNRLGSIEQGTTVSDWDEHEQRRAMSLSGSLCHLEWKERKINLVDTPGDAGFQADTYAALRVVEGVVVVLSGVMGVEVNTLRVWQRAEQQELSRVLFVNMLDRERADFFRVLEAARQQLSDRCVAIQLPVGTEHELTGIVDLLHMCAYMDPSGGREGGPQSIPDEMADLVREHRETLLGPRTHAKERLGQVLLLQGKDSETVEALGIGDLGAVAKLKDVVTGDVLVDHEVAVEPPHIDFPEPVMSFAVSPKAKGDEEKMGTGLRRLHEEDPTLIMRRDPQTGEQLLSGLSQMQVEVAVDRLQTRFHVDVELHPPRVPYKETIRKEARARHRYKKQTGGRGQFGDCEIVLEPLPAENRELGHEFVDKIVGGVISQSFRPAVDKGVREAMEHGELAGAPIQGVRVLLVDGMEHNVDSSEMAFKIAGSMAFKEAYAKASPVLLEPIMELEATVPDEAVGAVNGDLNSRRGRLQGMEPRGGMTTIKAEVPMSDILTYSQALTSLTGGRGDYHMHFLRYEEVPAHIAQKIIEATKKERETAKAG